ncbi:MAG: response regulator transcription factor [Kouleothrix sp.]|nr:response regulator transcription factor [Kouleothrix sp.]
MDEFRAPSQTADQSVNLEQLTDGDARAAAGRGRAGQPGRSPGLNLSVQTVANRLRVIHQKLQVNRTQAVLYALRRG